MILKPVVYRSLISRSPILRFAFWLGVVLSALMLFFSSAFFAICFVNLLCLSMGIVVQNYRQWEGGDLVPNFRRSQATAVLQISVGLVVITAPIAFLIHGFPLAGLTLLAAGGGLALISNGCITMFVFSTGLAACIIGWAYGTNETLEWFLANPNWLHEKLGVAAAVLGVLGHFHFWQMANRNGLHEKLPAHYLADSKKNTDSVSSIGDRSHWRRTSDLLKPINVFQALSAIRNLLIVVFLTAVIFIPFRGGEIYSAIILFYSAMALVCTPVLLLGHKLADSFERGWIIGICNDRASTARQLTALTAMQSTFVLLLVLISLTVLLPVNSPTYGKAILLMLAAFGMGAIVLLVSFWGMRFWYRNSDTAYVMLLGITAFCGAITLPLVESLFTRLDDYEFYQSGYPVLILGLIVAAAIMWKLSTAVASRIIAKQIVLME